MIRSSSNVSLYVPTVARQYMYVGRSRFWMASTFICLLFIIFLLSHSCYNSVVPSSPQMVEVSIKKIEHSSSVSEDSDEINVKANVLNTTPRRDLSANRDPDQSKNSQEFYGIMFDAGSTGSRVHVFQFTKETEDSPLRLMNETFEQIKPGLSSYKKQPVQGAKSLIPLLEIALSKIPPSKRRRTPVALKATAGLRLLPGNLADIILDEVEDVIDDYPFLYNNDSVKIMDGADEGIFSWMTVNFLLGSFSKGKPLVAALDLGGGSTQITFVPTAKETFADAPKEFFTDVELFGKKFHLYTHSYLGLGLMSARFQVMGGEEEAPPGNRVLSSPCLPADFTDTFEHHGSTFPVKGPSSTNSGFTLCYEDVKALVMNDTYDVDEVEELNSMPVYIFSYYYDRAVEIGLIDPEKGGYVTLKDYKSKAIHICNNPVRKYPYLCLDVVYIYSLLLDGFGLETHKKLHLKKKINGVEISWALGAMFDMLDMEDESS